MPLITIPAADLDIFDILLIIAPILIVVIVACLMMTLSIKSKKAQEQQEHQKSQAVATLLKAIGDATETRMELDKILEDAFDVRKQSVQVD